MTEHPIGAVEEAACSDHGCVFRRPRGMGTNGGCKCIYEFRYDPPEEGRKWRAERILRVRRAITAMRNRIEELERERAEPPQEEK